MRALGLAALLGVASCGWSEEKFIDQLVDAECTLLMECYDASVLDFLEWETIDDCIVDRGTFFATEAQGCDYDKKAAKPCIKALEEATCPAEGVLLDYPSECEGVLTGCEGGSDTDDTDDTADTADTDL